MTTLEMLQAEFSGPTAPLSEVADKYLGMKSKKAGEFARLNTLPLPAHRLGSQKSPWLVSLVDLAKLIDEKEAEARTDWEARQ
jgi:hypothetical protein